MAPFGMMGCRGIGGLTFANDTLRNQRTGLVVVVVASAAALLVDGVVLLLMLT